MASIERWPDVKEKVKAILRVRGVCAEDFPASKGIIQANIYEAREEMDSDFGETYLALKDVDGGREVRCERQQTLCIDQPDCPVADVKTHIQEYKQQPEVTQTLRKRLYFFP
ncbi:hypothetical protein Bbelb_338720 [Branchiostoma belcheri]|nr:hypothetical protein Bbelb_338720 [Branchiostoma belcheri]